eukprot:TRINITY_DN13129_c0_g1_i1.p1 TRINITY_DN13129_c0_g1~~TRINITY_DN13129_c0_g1_i1.p1  ORF type:complete len:543 (-),score=80.97 TRINITY_DN13129_c0_g1_i1:158-1786(-)
MIYYSAGEYQLGLLWRLKGSVFPRASVVATPAGLLAVVLKILQTRDILDITAQNFLDDNAAYSGFMFVIGFLLVFRTSQAFARFWEGSKHVCDMTTNYTDAAGSLVAFTQNTKAETKDVKQFLNLLVQLFSLMHALGLEELSHSSNYPLLTIGGIDELSRKHLESVPGHCRAHVVCQWLQQLIVDGVKTEILNVPPPLLTRSYQELANGMNGLAQAARISQIPFPFPYVQISSLLLVMHWVLTPLLMCLWAGSAPSAFVFAFTPVFSLWCIHLIASEIEMPFGTDYNDLPLHDMQVHMNEVLMTMISRGSERVPTMDAEAERWCQEEVQKAILGDISRDYLESNEARFEWAASEARRDFGINLSRISDVTNEDEDTTEHLPSKVFEETPLCKGVQDVALAAVPVAIVEGDAGSCCKTVTGSTRAATADFSATVDLLLDAAGPPPVLLKKAQSDTSAFAGFNASAGSSSLLALRSPACSPGTSAPIISPLSNGHACPAAGVRDCGARVASSGLQEDAIDPKLSFRSTEPRRVSTDVAAQLPRR